MKKLTIFFLILSFVAVFAGCQKVDPKVETTAPVQETEPEQTQPTTVDPFEFETEIDFSDFETVAPTEHEETDPSVTEGSVQPRPTEPAATQPVPTEPAPTTPTEPDPAPATDPEETQTPATAPSIADDGYNNQIVKP